MDINTMDQGLLIRNPSLTREEFSHHWYHKHAPLVIPMFLHLGVQHYQQIHPPFTLAVSPSSTSNTLIPLSFDGVAGLPPQSTLDAPSNLPKWVQAYYDEVIKTDERRFLVSEALEHIIRVPPKTVEGEVRVVIKEGKALIDVPEEVWRVWREYEERGRNEGERKEEKREDGDLK
ncbi:hypothetical protein ONS95_000701 [Cadophora gregata]|uniref:uncharacterized protein n=1 Tax=Cadophora gregata TaxID=51156 RepID=UPI0026DB3103|nr:uncharacterized protein ONS95_000701 [Cadophora gregata]KAK0103124.1 hypothetical protein ONS96_005732 [Cadophora gregata f. sp. sojae]KAK0128746.1 hypothetical protein ONS95_000701 [Cadophora gregata]